MNIKWLYILIETYLILFRNYITILLILIFFIGCGNEDIPKPRGYFRIDLPLHEYQIFRGDCPYTFNYSKYSTIEFFNRDSCWINISYYAYKAKIYITYKQLHNNIDTYSEDSRTLVYKHAIKAEAILEKPWENEADRVFGIVYDIDGNTASSTNFILTDSITHWVRGALYFNIRPNSDSLLPVTKFIKEDIRVLVESFRWKTGY